MNLISKTSLFLAAATIITPSLDASTAVNISGTVLVPHAKRMGVNLGGHNFYDSGQYLKNLANGNPGFEPQLYQSVVGCASGGGDRCTDSQQYDTWPTHYWQNGTFRVISGQAKGRTGTITDSTTGTPYSTTAFQFSSGSPAIAVGDYVVVEQQSPGVPVQGTVNGGPSAVQAWWTSASGTFSADAVPADQAPNTTGVQCLKMDGSGGQSATISSAFDSLGNGKTFFQMNGSYQLNFKAKLLSGSNPLVANVGRNATFLNQSVPLTPSWQSYSIPFTASENGTQSGTGWVNLTVNDTVILIDDVSVVPVGGDGTNTTIYSDAMVSTLRTLHPGILRDWEGQLGDSFDNLVTPEFGRKPSGFRISYGGSSVQEGLHDFLQLCELIGAEPWYVIPTNWSPTDMQHLMEYLGGSASTAYGAKRVALGHAAPWTSSFPQMHFEFGNENWNGGFAGGIIGSLNFTSDITTYAQRASELFSAAKASPYYVGGGEFDFVMGGQAVNDYVAGTESNASSSNDSYATAPYLGSYETDGTDEQLFGPLFAETEWWSQPGGYQGKNVAALKGSSHPVPLSVYEENMNSVNGLSQSTVNAFLPSLGAGLALGNHMLMQLRDLGVVNQNIFALPQYGFSYSGQNDPIWGIVYDMGVTNRRRPQFLAAQLINQAIGSGADVWQTTQSGDNPTWNGSFQSDNVTLTPVPNANDIETFAFSNGSIILMNLSRSSDLDVTFTGAQAPSGTLLMERLTSGSLRDTNETSTLVLITSSQLNNFNPAQPFTLPRYSMTLLMPTSASGGSSAPTITSQPQNTTALVGQSATFAVGATGNPSPTYQWRYEAGSWVNYVGATQPTFTITNAQLNQNGTVFDVVVSNSAGTVTSTPVVMTVNSTANPGSPAPTPTILPPSETFSGPMAVTLNSIVPGALIYFTTDGTTPSSQSTLYSVPFVVAQSEVIKAISYVTGNTPSAILTSTYTRSANSNAPVVNAASISVYPNPWRKDKHDGKKMIFNNLPVGSTVTLFTISGHQVKTLASTEGVAEWDLTTVSGSSVASGIYLFVVKQSNGETSRGTVAVIN